MLIFISVAKLFATVCTCEYGPVVVLLWNQWEDAAAHLHTYRPALGCNHSCRCCWTWLCSAGALSPLTGSSTPLTTTQIKTFPISEKNNKKHFNYTFKIRKYLGKWIKIRREPLENSLASVGLNITKHVKSLNLEMDPPQYPGGIQHSRRAGDWSWKSPHGRRRGRCVRAAAGWSGWRWRLSVALSGGPWSHLEKTPANWSS